MTKTKYLTTPLYYVNAKPHIGHAYTNVIADTFARFYKFTGEKALLLTGTDEHGTKIEKIAREKNLNPKDFVDQMVPHFKSLWKLLDICYDDFIRTTEDRHKRIVAKVLTDLETKGDIYKATYEGWYCTPCESFWTELQLEEGKCPDCSRDVQRLSEDNYFFRLSKYQEWLIAYIHAHPEFICPEIRRNEILGFLKEQLEDLCISRPRARLGWGIDYPTSNEHVVYVWFDALINYISAIGYGEKPEYFTSLWPADIHFVGKDILRQHTVYWPIMLRALDLPLPKTVVAHGWWTMQGAKVSKSLGNIVEPTELVQKYGVDAFRYFLLKEVTLGYDGAFSEILFRERYTTDLANDLGNLWFRMASMMDKYFQGEMPALASASVLHPLYQNSLGLWDLVCEAMKQWDPRQALSAIFAVVKQANQFVEENKPWVLAKSPASRDELAQVLAVLAEAVAHVAVVLLPFLPDTAGKISERLGRQDAGASFDKASFTKPFLQTGIKLTRGEILFPKLEEEKPQSSPA
ncbi:MAG: methionine--tRNA ligase [Candidatus Omnitrophica bacterium]|nr:methionine--tRNA ligase [Candidatus Omnitrophota bacterium]